MQKINIFVHSSKKIAVLELLQEKGILEVVDIADESENVDYKNCKSYESIDEKVQKYEYDIAEITFALNFLKNYIPPKKKKLHEIIAGETVKTNPEKIQSIVKNYNHQEIIQKVKDYEAEMVAIKNQLKKLSEEETVMTPWESFPLSLSAATETESTKMLLGKIDKRDYDLLEQEMIKISPYIYTHSVSNTDTEVYIYTIYLKNEEEKIFEVLEDFNFQETTFLKSEKTPKEELHWIKQKMKNLRQKLHTLEKEAENLTKNQKNLKIVHDYLVWCRDKSAAPGKFRFTEDTAIIAGWVPEVYFPELEKTIKKQIKECEIIQVKPKKDEQAPVQILNKKFMEPFESVTNVYGLPLYSEVDPTPFLSIFFIIFFGMCLSDAGYGILLFALSFSAIKFLDLDPAIKKLLKLIMYGGVSTFIMGILYGGFFGLTPEQLPGFLSYEKEAGIRFFYGQLFNPVKEPIKILLMAIIAGTLQVMVGISVDLWWKIKHGKVWEGILDSGTWLYFLGSIILFVLASIDIIPFSLTNITLYLIYIGVAVLILTQGRAQKSIIGKLGIGLLSLYNLVGYASDILSYSRLLALGLATGIIAMAVNIVGALANDKLPYIGWIIMIIIIIGGHTFNIAISTLGSFIHSARLQFVEFFGKFMQGGGNAFTPLQKVCKYIRLERKE